MIDFCDMKGIHVDPKARTVRAEPGLRWSDFDRETQAFGLATTGGTVGDTGIAGLTLGGGFGWLGGTLGMTVDNVLSADLVIANGELVHASASENPDLFWALRGGGGNFGVVTSFTYQLHPVGPLIVGGMAVHPFSAANDVLRFYSEVISNAPDHLTAACALLSLPDGQKACAIVVACTGPAAEAEKLVAPIKTFGSPLVDIIGPMPYVAQQSLLENALPPNVLNYWKADFVASIGDGVIANADRRVHQCGLADVVDALLSDSRRRAPGVRQRHRVSASHRHPRRRVFAVEGPDAERRQRRVGPQDMERHAAVPCPAASTPTSSAKTMATIGSGRRMPATTTVCLRSRRNTTRRTCSA